MRLDIYISNLKKISRTKSQNIITSGYVKVNGEIVKKSSFIVNENDEILIENNPFFDAVGRGKFKLEKALDDFKIDVNLKTCLDVGTSSGGFAQALLERNPLKVIGVDVGQNQIDKKLFKYDNFILFENTDIRDFKTDIKFDIITIDLSFISSLEIYSKITDLIKDNGIIIQLFKPQFEIGKKQKFKNGVVKDKKLHIELLKNFVNSLNKFNFFVDDMIFSPILGGEGNIEYFLKIMKINEKNVINENTIINTVNNAFNILYV